MTRWPAVGTGSWRRWCSAAAGRSRDRRCRTTSREWWIGSAPTAWPATPSATFPPEPCPSCCTAACTRVIAATRMVSPSPPRAWLQTSVSVAAGESDDRATRSLIGPAAEPGLGVRKHAPLLGECQTPGDAGLRLLIKCLRDRGRTALLGQCDHNQLDLLRAAPDGETVAGFERTRRLDAITVDVHLAAVHGLGGQRPCLEEAGGPQPLVDSNASCFRSLALSHSVSVSQAAAVNPQNSAQRTWIKTPRPGTRALGGGQAQTYVG